jgi:hypothetical protein
LLCKLLAEFVGFCNGAWMHKVAGKPGPSGMLRNEAFSLPESWGGRNCPLLVNVEVIHEFKEAMGGDGLLEFTSADFSEEAQAVYDTLNVFELSLENVWFIFQAMYLLLFPQNCPLFLASGTYKV